jgi:uncharacterized protein (TIGR03085 family)
MARVERASLADLLAELGPDQPTLCGDWTTRDLAAHLVVRDRRPDAAAGIAIKALSGHTERVQGHYAESRPYDTLIEQVRRPPALSMAGVPALDRATNTGEFFIHHEDIRRAQPDWSPRPLDKELGQALLGQLKLIGKLRLRRVPGKVTINMPGYGQPIVGGAGGPEVTMTGDPGELTLFFSGRQRVARVDLDGPADVTESLRTAKYGI